MVKRRLRDTERKRYRTLPRPGQHSANRFYRARWPCGPLPRCVSLDPSQGSSRAGPRAVGDPVEGRGAAWLGLPSHHHRSELGRSRRNERFPRDVHASDTRKNGKNAQPHQKRARAVLVRCSPRSRSDQSKTGKRLRLPSPRQLVWLLELLSSLLVSQPPSLEDGARPSDRPTASAW